MEINDIKENFIKDIKDHALTVVREDGLYRHIRCQRSDSWVYGFEIITWPGYLAYVGDMGDYVFKRIPDMFDFFGSNGINPSYWSEKVVAECYDKIREFSEEEYRKQVEKWRDNIVEDIETPYDGDEEDRAIEQNAFIQAVNNELLDYLVDSISEEECYRLLSEFKHNDIQCYDAWEWDFKTFTYRYIWALYAITWAIGQYNNIKKGE